MTTQMVKQAATGTPTDTREQWSSRPAVRLVVANQDFRVSKGSIRRYRSVVETASRDARQAPALFPVLAAAKASRQAVEALLARPDAAAPGDGGSRHVIQVSHEMTIERPVRAGETLHSEVAVSPVRPTRLGSRADLGVSVHDSTGDLVASFVNGLLLRSSASGPHLVPEIGSLEPRGADSDDWSTTLSIAYTRSYEYAWVTGDYNPIHFDRYSALSAGLPCVVANGMCTLAMVVDHAVQTMLDGDETAVRRVSCRFSRPVRLGQELGVILRPMLPEEADHGSGELVSLRVMAHDGLALKGLLEVGPA